MAFEAKICGLTTPEAVETAIDHGASHIGLVFFAKSPRNIAPEAAGRLSRLAAGRVVRTGLIVDESDERIAAILEACPLDLLQLHGQETPERVAEIRRKFGLPVMKVLQIGTAEDLARASSYESVADRLLFDAKPPASKADALPGGNAVSFDWSLLAGRHFGLPWMLAGGLTADNLAEAVRASGARAADISSGVEDRPGQKNLQKIKDFLRVARGL
jgi:phosphoribosylanthranilate isomerase